MIYKVACMKAASLKTKFNISINISKVEVELTLPYKVLIKI